MYECERIQERITRLASGIAIIRVGAFTEVEMIEKKHRIEDALEAVKSAQLEGIVPGGGIALLRATKDLEIDLTNEDQEFGARVVIEATRAPIKQMALNAGVSPDLIINAVLTSEGDVGYNFSTYEFVDLLAHGVIDPVKVTRLALQNAVSVSSILLTTNYSIVVV